MSEVENFEMEPEEPQPEVRGLPVGYNLVDWEQQIIMLKTACKLVEK